MSNQYSPKAESKDFDEDAAVPSRMTDIRTRIMSSCSPPF